MVQPVKTFALSASTIKKVVYHITGIKVLVRQEKGVIRLFCRSGKQDCQTLERFFDTYGIVRRSEYGQVIKPFCVNGNEYGYLVGIEKGNNKQVFTDIEKVN